jgi:hypothetical protein
MEFGLLAMLPEPFDAIGIQRSVGADQREIFRQSLCPIGDSETGHERLIRHEPELFAAL